MERKVSTKILIFLSVILLLFATLGSFFFFIQKPKESNFDGSLEVTKLTEKYKSGKKVQKTISTDLIENENINIYDFCNNTNTKIDEDETYINLTYGDFSVNIDKQNNFLVDNNGNVVYFENTNNNTYPIYDIAKSLGFEISTNQNQLKLTRPFQTKRIIVEAKGEFDDINAIEKVNAYGNTYILQFKTEAETESAITKLKSQKNIISAEPNIIVTLEDELPIGNNSISASTEEELFSWGIESLGIDDYKTYLNDAFGSDNLETITVAVLDTGIDTDHPTFSGRISKYSHNFVDSTTPNNPEDDHGHGTHVSGIICDLTYSNVQILSLKVLNENGEGELIFILNAIEYATNLKSSSIPTLKVLNMSLGGNSSVESAGYTAYKTKIDAAYDAGVLSVVAAGNGDPDNYNYAVDVATVSPANIDTAITVGAVGLDYNNNYYIGYFSNYGDYIDISAPGIDIVSAYIGGGRKSLDGTSMATPHISAVIALLLSDKAVTYETLAEVESALKFYVTDTGEIGWDKYFGVGVPDLTHAYCERLEPVIFSRTETKCSEPFELTLSHSNAETSVKILYTLDGSSPTIDNATEYTDKIQISSTTTVKAIACVIYEGTITKCSKISQIIYQFDFVTDEYGTLLEYNGDETDVVVPETVNGISIIAIGDECFLGNSTVVSVTLPEGVTYIGYGAFANCVSLEKVTAPKVVYVDDDAFYGCEKLNCLTSGYFPELRTISRFAFMNCSEISTISLPKVTYIGENAFANCTKISGISLDNLIVLGGGAFINASQLSLASLPKCQIISTVAFKNCNLLSINFQEAVLVGAEAFVGNNSLLTADLPKAIYLGNNCFYNTNIDKITATNTQIIGRYAFAYCSNLTEVNFPNAIRVEYGAFSNSALKKATLTSTRILESYVFQSTQISELDLPAISKIYKDCFLDLSTFTELTLSHSIEYLEPYAINNCVNLTIYGYSGTVAQTYAIDYGYNFSPLDANENSFIYNIFQNKEIHITGFRDSLTQNAIIPDYISSLPVTKILDSAFKDCTKIAQIQSNTIVSIETSAFENCSNLTSIFLPKIEDIGDFAFKGCTSLSEVSFSENLLSIGASAFENCDTLSSFSFGKSLTSIGEYAVGYSDSVVRSDFIIFCYEQTLGETYAVENGLVYYYQATELESFYYGYYEPTEGTQEIILAFIPKYINGEIIIPSSYNGITISGIAANAFEDCVFITSVTLPSTIKIIGDYAFTNCSLLSEINLGSVEFIGDYAFAYCYRLSYADLSSAYYIGESSFRNCSELQSVNIGSTSEIYNFTFFACTKLHTVLGSNITTIGNYAFWQNNNLVNIDLTKLQNVQAGFTTAHEEIRLPAIQVISTSAFSDSTNLKRLVVNKTISTVYSSSLPQRADFTAYGYTGTVIETYCNNYNVNFVPIEDLSIVKSLNSLYEFDNVSTSSTIPIQTKGFGINYKWYKNTTPSRIGATLVKDSSENTFDVDILTVEEYYIYCALTDWLGETLDSNIACVSVTFAVYHKVTTSVFGKGSISPSGETLIKNNTDATFYFFPARGYEIEKVLIDGQNIGKAISHKFPSISADHEIAVYFTIIKLTITSSTNGFGDITPEGENIVDYGTETTFLFTPHTGYELDYVAVDGEKVSTINSSYTFLSPTRDYEIIAYFKIISLEINIISNGANVNPVGKCYINYGDPLKIDIANTVEFMATTVLRDGEVSYIIPATTNSLSYKISKVTDEFTIEIVTIPHPYEVKISTGENGKAENETIVKNYNETVVINFLPNDGYEVSKLLLDGNNIEPKNSFEINNISANHEIWAEFELIQYKISFDLGGFGTIVEGNDDTATYGENRLYTIKSNPLYEIGDVYVNGELVDILDGNKISLSNINDDTQVLVTFKKNLSLPIIIIILVVLLGVVGIVATFIIRRRIKVNNRKKTNLTSMLHSSKTTNVKNIKIKEEFIVNEKPKRKNKKS